jgi:hypothetical protein
MKKLIAIITLALISQTAIANTSFDDIKVRTEALEITKGELLKEIALDTIKANNALDEAQLIEKYANSRGTIYQGALDFIGQNPAAIDATFLGAVTSASFAAQRLVINPALTKEAVSTIERLIQRFPKMSKAAPWVATLATAAVVIRETYVVSKMFEYDGMTSQELINLYAHKMEDYNHYRDNVVLEARELQKTITELDQLHPATATFYYYDRFPVK